MSTIATLDVDVVARLDKLSRGFRDASDMAGAFEKDIDNRIGSGLAIGGPDPGGSLVQAMTQALAPLGGLIQSGLKQSIAPLQSFASTFGRQFEEVGATVDKLSVRIDDAMRFPVFLQRAEKFRMGLRKTFFVAGKDAKEAFEKAMKGNLDASVAANLLAPDAAEKATGRFVRGVAKALGGLRDSVRKKVAPIAQDMGYALDAAEHVDRSAAFPLFIQGIEDFRRQVIAAGAIDPNVIDKQLYDSLTRGQKSAFTRARNAAKKLLADQQTKVPPSDNTTHATWSPKPELLRARSLKLTLSEVYEGGKTLLKLPIQAFGASVDKMIGSWLSIKKVQSVVSTFGSVANATFGKLKQVSLPKLSIDPRNSTALKGIGSAADRAGSSMRSFGQQVAVALGFFGLTYKAVGFFKDGIKGAADLNETLSKTEAILGDAAPAVTKFADEMASKFGLVKRKTLDVAASFAGLGKGLGGLTGGALSAFSTKFTGIAADLSSYANLDFEEAAKALSTGLAGNQSDVLKSLGVVYDETKLKSYALAHGFKLVGGQLSEQQKLMARAGVITEGLADAIGDLDKTQGSVTNKTRKFHGQIENLATSIGQMLLPAVSKGLDILTEFGSWAQSAFEGAKSSFEDFGSSLTTTFEAIGILFRNWPAVFEIARLKIVEGLINLGEYLDTFGENAALIGRYFADNWIALIIDIGRAFNTVFGNIGINLTKLGTAIGEFLADPTGGFNFEWTGLLDSFEATAEKLPELIKPHLTDMGKEIQAQVDLIAANEAKRLDGAAIKKAGRNVNIPKPGEAAAKDGTPKLAAALDVHSVEARSSALTAIVGKGDKTLAQSGRDTAANTGRSATALQDIRRAILNAKAPVEMSI